MKRNWKRILSLWLTVCMVFTMNFGLGATAVYATPGNGQVEATITVDTSKTSIVKGNSLNASDVFTVTTEADANVAGYNQANHIVITYKLGDHTYTNDEVTNGYTVNTPGEYTFTVTVARNEEGGTPEFNLVGETTKSATVTVTKDKNNSKPTINGTALDATGAVGWTLDAKKGKIEIQNNITADAVDVMVISGNTALNDEAIKALEKDDANIKLASTKVNENGGKTDITIAPSSIDQTGFIYARFSETNDTLSGNWQASEKYTVPMKEEDVTGDGYTLEKYDDEQQKYVPITNYDANVNVNDETGDITVGLKRTVARLKVQTASELTINTGDYNSDIYLLPGGAQNEITVNSTSGTVNVFAGDEGTKLLTKDATELFLTDLTETKGEAITTTGTFVAVTAAETTSNADNVFEAADGADTFALKNQDSETKVVAEKTGVITYDPETKVYTLAEGGNLYTVTSDGKISEAYTFESSGITGATETKLGTATFSNIKKKTVSVNIADASTDIPEGSLIYVSADGLNPSVMAEIKFDGTTAKAGITGLDAGETYNKIYLEKAAEIGGEGENAKKVKLGFKLNVTLAPEKALTTRTGGNFDGVNITSVKPYQITLSADKADTYYALLISGNGMSETKATEIATSKFEDAKNKDALDATAFKVLAVNEEGTSFGKAAEDGAYDDKGNEVDINENTDYFLFGVSVNGTTVVNDPELISVIKTGKKRTFTPTLSVKQKNIEYAGKDVGVSENIVAGLTTENDDEEDNDVGVAILPLKDYKPELGLEGNYEASEAEDYKKENYKDKNGWPADKYVAIAQFEGDPLYYGDEYVTTSASANFTVDKKKIYMKPVPSVTTVSAGAALGSDFSGFDYVVLDGDGEKVTDVSFGETVGDEGYIFTTVSGEQITSETKFNEGSHKIYVSQNKADIVTENDGESYEIISGYNNKNSLYETITAIKLQTPRIDATGKDLYYYAYTELVKENKTTNKTALHKAMADYVKVTMGSTDITKDARIQFLYWDSANKTLVPSEKVPEGLSANDIIFISANYAEHSGDETWKTDEYVTLKIKQQPVGIVGTDEQGNARNAEKRDEEYDLDKAITIYVVDEDGTLSEDKVVRSDLYKTTADISKKAFDIDISGVNNTVAGSYSKLPMTWDSASLNSTKDNDWFTKNYVIDSTNTYVKTYTIKPVVNVRVLDATDGSVISSNVIDGKTTLYSYTSDADAYTFAVSLNKADPAAFKYNGAYDEDEGKNSGSVLVGSNKNNYPYIGVAGDGYVYTFSLDKYFEKYDESNDADLDLYAYYQDKDSSTANSSGTVTIAAIEPVYYNGYKHVTSATAFKKGQKNDIYLEVKAANGDTLVQDTDYKVSYKNNTNVGYASDAKAPQVIIKGIGQYKGLKITAKFTILPQKFSDVIPTIKSQYVPLTKKGVLKLGETLTLGKKINKGFYTLSYRNLGDNNAVVTQAQLAAAYEGTKVMHLAVYATSVNPKGKKVNFSIGDTVYIGSIYAYPKGSKTLKVKLANKGKITYSTSKTTMKVSDFIDGKNETVTIGKTTVSKDMLDLDQAKFYKDKNFTKGGETEPDDAGTYYLMVVPKAEYMAKLGVYKPTAVKVEFTGEKLTKKLISLATKKQAGVGKALNWKLNTSLTYGKDFEVSILDAAGNKCYGLNLTQTSNKDGYTLYAGDVYDDDGTDKIDKGAGTFTLVIEGIGKYSGELKLKYSYGKASVKSLGYKGIQVNGGKAVVYDPSEGAAENGTYQQMILTILSANDTASKYTGKMAAYGSLDDLDEIKSIAVTGSKVGKNTGKVTITFKHYTGKLTGKFDIEQVAVDTTNIRKASIYKGEKSAKVFLAQKIDGVDYAFKKGTDFKLSNFSALNDTTGQVTIDITSKGRIKGSSMTGITFPIYSGKVTDVKIAALSENEGVVKAGEKYNTVSAAEVSYNSVGKYYDYKGTSGAVMPKVEKVTCKIDGKETTVPASSYDVTYIPATGLDKDGNTIYVKGTYKVIITFNANSGNTYPSFTSYGFTYKVNEATK